MLTPASHVKPILSPCFGDFFKRMIPTTSWKVDQDASQNIPLARGGRGARPNSSSATGLRETDQTDVSTMFWRLSIMRMIPIVSLKEDRDASQNIPLSGGEGKRATDLEQRKWLA